MIDVQADGVVLIRSFLAVTAGILVLFAGKAIEQARLAYVWRPGKHHLDARAQQASLAAAGKQLGEPAAQPRKARGRIVAMQRVHFLLREVERRLRERAQIDELRA